MTTESMRRFRSRVERDDEAARRLSNGGKRIDESGSFLIPARTFRRDPWERAALQRFLTPPGAIVTKPTYMPTKDAFEVDWRRTRYEVQL